MSNSYAISAVTATLSYLLRSEGKTIITRPPDSIATGTPRLNIFLYHVAQNLGYKNMDIPARGPDGDLVKKQQVGLDLYYLLTAYGNNDDELSAQRILAETMMTLHEKPILTRELIDAAISDHDIKGQMSDINQADLSKQIELVKMTLHPLSIDDMTKIWSSLFKTAYYRISVAYKATVVLLDGMQEARTAMPVREYNIYSMIPKQPEITYITPPLIEWSSSSMTMTINGKSLKADKVMIDFGEGLELKDMPSPTSSSDEKLIIDIPITFAAGIRQVKVIHPLSMGTPNTLHRGSQSNIALFAVTPKISSALPTSLASGGKLTIKVEPKIQEQQEVRVIFGTHRPLVAESISPINNTNASTVNVRIPADLKKGTCAIRIRVDGAESLPDDSIPNEFKRPTVEIV